MVKKALRNTIKTYKQFNDDHTKDLLVVLRRALARIEELEEAQTVSKSGKAHGSYL